MANARLYPFWGSLTEALRTGEPQNEAKRGGDLFGELYADPARLKGFVKAMTGLSQGPAQAIAAKFPWRDHRTFIDIGMRRGRRCRCRSPRRTRTSPAAASTCRRSARSSRSTSPRTAFRPARASTPGDFFADPLPQADVLVMGHILHDWDLEQKRLLIGKAYEALPPGGALIVYDAIIDDERRENAFGLLMSLNMLIETRGGFDYTGADCPAGCGGGLPRDARGAPGRARLDGGRGEVGARGGELPRAGL